MQGQEHASFQTKHDMDMIIMYRVIVKEIVIVIVITMGFSIYAGTRASF
jgi:hypothetical protein